MNTFIDDPEFDSILAQCMEDVQRQHRTVDECLQTYPHYAAALKPLLLAGLMTSKLKAPQLSSQAVNAIELKLRAQMKKQPRVMQRRSGIAYGLSRLAAMVAIALLLAFGSSAGLVAASSNSLPGDPLYGIKRLWEAIILALSPLTGPQDLLWQHIAETRLDEIERLAAEGKLDETALLDFYSALYYFSGFSSVQNDPKIMALMQNTASALLMINPPAEAEVVYKEVLRLAQDNVRTGIVKPPPAELPASIIQLTMVPTLIPSATLAASIEAATATIPGTATRTPLPSATATVTASPSVTPIPTLTVTPSRTPRIPPTATKTITPTVTITATATATITPTSTWTALPLPSAVVPGKLPTATATTSVNATNAPYVTPEIEATRIRETEQSVFLTQTAGPPSMTAPSPDGG